MTRGLAAALALVALAGQLSSFAHLALVRHVTCAEHGEMIEVGRAHASAAAVTHRPAVSAVTESSAAAEHGHEHCLLTPMRRDRLAASAPASLDSAHVDAYGTIGVTGAAAIAPPIPLFVLAPKNSPPLA